MRRGSDFVISLRQYKHWRPVTRWLVRSWTIDVSRCRASVTLSPRAAWRAEISHDALSAICRLPIPRSTYTYYWLPRGHSTHRDVDIEPNTVTALLPQAETKLTWQRVTARADTSSWPAGRYRTAGLPAHLSYSHTLNPLTASSSSFHPSASVVFTSTTTGQPDFRPIVSSCSGWRKVATFSHVTIQSTLYTRSVLAGPPAQCSAQAVIEDRFYLAFCPRYTRKAADALNGVHLKYVWQFKYLWSCSLVNNKLTDDNHVESGIRWVFIRTNILYCVALVDI